MIVYVETNFVLEHALGQEQAHSCEEILALAERSAIRLVVPAFSLAESRLGQRQVRQRRLKLRDDLDLELRQMRRSKQHETRVEDLGGVTARLVEGAEDDAERLDATLSRIGTIADVIALDGPLAAASRDLERKHDLSPGDALVFAAVLAGLGRTSAEPRTPSCFLNRNSKDFEDPDIVSRLELFGCRLISRFDQGLEYISSVLGSPPADAPSPDT